MKGEYGKTRDSPRLDDARVVACADARVGQMPLDDLREHLLRVFEREERGEIEVAREEVGGDELAGGVDALRVSASSWPDIALTVCRQH